MAADDTKDKETSTKETAKEEQAEVVFRYLSEENPNNASYPGVPLGDILAHQYDTYPKWIQKSIAESPTSPYKAVEAKKKADDKADAGGK
jgi:hypothetical protein